MKKAVVFIVCIVCNILLNSVYLSAQSVPLEETDYIGRGTAYLKDGSYEEAVEEFRRAREKDPGSSIAAYYLGIAYKKSHDYGNAKTYLNEAVTLRPAVREAVVELADVQFQLGETNDALSTIEGAERDALESSQAVFLKGLILLKLFRNIDAIDSFKKAETMDGRLTEAADYQMALANMQEGRLAEAKALFKEIIIRDPNSDMAQFAKQYMDAITKRLKEERPVRLSFDLQYQHDDNVLLKPGDSAVATDITHIADSAAVSVLRVEYVPKLRRPFDLKTQYCFYLNKHFELSRYDVQSHTLNLVPAYSFSYGQVSLITGYSYTMVDNDSYLHGLTLSPTYTLVLNKNQFTQASVSYQNRKYIKPPININEDRDSNDYGAGLSWFYLIYEGKGFVNIRYDLNRENTKGKNWVYTGNKPGISILYPVTDRFTLNVNGEAYLQNFLNTHTAFKKKREDKTYTSIAMLSYTIRDDINVQVQYVHIRGDSNVTVYDYNKNIITAGVGMRF